MFLTSDPHNTSISAEKWNIISKLRVLGDDDYVPEYNMNTWSVFCHNVKKKYEALCRGDDVYRVSHLCISYVKALSLHVDGYRVRQLCWRYTSQVGVFKVSQLFLSDTSEVGFYRVG